LTTESNHDKLNDPAVPKVTRLRLAEILIPMSLITVIQFININDAAIITSGLVMWFIVRLSLLNDNPRYYGIRSKDIKRGFQNSKMLLIVLLLIIRPISIIITTIMGASQDIAYNFYDDPFLYLSSVLFIAPVFEELMFRGVFQERLNWFISEFKANIVVSLFFTLAHWGGATIYSFAVISLFRFIHSLFYGAIYARTRNIIHSSFAHFADNLYATVVTVLFP
jgi:membrane protease YdiL (CAAX protease family)